METSEKKTRRSGVRTVTEVTEFIRLPKSGDRCVVTGLSRSALCGLVLPSLANGGKPPVKSKVLKSNPGNMRGIRLIHVGSLLQFLNREEDQDQGS
ncbi:MAG: hypothetical protein V4675_10925 [Verrucomicrobiota bacterium]